MWKAAPDQTMNTHILIKWKKYQSFICNSMKCWELLLCAGGLSRTRFRGRWSFRLFVFRLILHARPWICESERHNNNGYLIIGLKRLMRQSCFMHLFLKLMKIKISHDFTQQILTFQCRGLLGSTVYLQKNPFPGKWRMLGQGFPPDGFCCWNWASGRSTHRQ